MGERITRDFVEQSGRLSFQYCNYTRRPQKPRGDCGWSENRIIGFTVKKYRLVFLQAIVFCVNMLHCCVSLKFIGEICKAYLQHVM